MSSTSLLSQFETESTRTINARKGTFHDKFPKFQMLASLGASTVADALSLGLSMEELTTTFESSLRWVAIALARETEEILKGLDAANDYTRST